MSDPVSTKPTIRMMRLTTRLRINGPVLQAVLLSAKMRDYGYETQLIGGNPPSEETDVMERAASYGVEPVVMPGLTQTLNPLTLVSLVRELADMMRTYQPHIVHTHTTTAGFLGRLAARIAGVPVIVHTLHVYPFEGYYNRVTTSIFILLERFGARLSDSIITLSEGLRRQLTESYPITRKQRIIVLPLGLDLTPYTQMKRHRGHFREAYGIPDNVPLIGIIGQLLPVKNHALFLQAAQIVKVTVPDAHFVIIGDGEQRPMLERRAQALGLEGHITFTSWIEDVAAAYSDMDLLVNSSHNEGTPLPLIEALAAGCPVVATHVGGIPDLLDGGRLGALVSPNDPQALAEAMVHTLQTDYDPQPAREAMVNRYAVERLAQDLDSLYRGLLAKKGVTFPVETKEPLSSH